MPRGIYPRGNKEQAPAMPVRVENSGLNTVTVGQLPDRQSANANVETMRQTHGDETISTTERLFGDIALRDKAEEANPEMNNSIAQGPEEPVTPEPTPQEPSPQEPAPQEPVQPEPQKPPQLPDEALDLDKKIKAKIDGREEILTVRELRDQYQIKKHLAEAADKVGEERRKLAEERRQIQELRQQRQNQYQAPIPQENGTPQMNGSSLQQPMPDYSNPVLQRIQFLEAQLQQLAQGTQPVIYQSNRQRVSDELKSQGFGDFLDYIPKMETHLTGIQDQQLMSFYDTPQGAKALYFQLKAQDMKAASSRPQPVPHGTQDAVPQTIPNTRIDSGSSSGSNVDDSGHLYRQAFRRATTLGDDKEAWNEVLRQKGILPD